MNHLALTLNVEEPLITSVAIRPGTVDTAMQKQIREEHSVRMDRKDAEKFAGLYGRGELLKPEQPGNVIARLALNAPSELGGKFLRFVTSTRSSDRLSLIFLKPFANVEKAGMIKISKTSRTLEWYVLSCKY
jgi:NAD(P)-dependent dehydrogenase (short-subunit alcohol dehydrogenase family)